MQGETRLDQVAVLLSDWLKIGSNKTWKNTFLISFVHGWSSGNAAVVDTYGKEHGNTEQRLFVLCLLHSPFWESAVSGLPEPGAASAPLALTATSEHLPSWLPGALLLNSLTSILCNTPWQFSVPRSKSTKHIYNFLVVHVCIYFRITVILQLYLSRLTDLLCCTTSPCSCGAFC